MKRRFYILLLALASFLMMGASGCEQRGPDCNEPVGQADLSLIKQSVPVTDNWVWSGKPQITVHVENPNAAAVKVGVKVRITTDSKQLVTELLDSVEIAGNGKVDHIMTTPEDMEPGFYRAVCFVNGKNARSFIFGIDPFKIVSEPDMQPDFEQFWQAAKDQLAAVEMAP